MKMIIFSKNMCPYCDAAKSFLQEQNVEYEEIDISTQPEKMRELVEMTGMMTVPQIFQDSVSRENLIGGYDNMMQLYREGKLFNS